VLIYDYKCKKCGDQYYYRTDAPYSGESLQCPDCGSEDFELSQEPISENYSGWGSCSTMKFG
jgi:putative FmdB family regulatory protein